MKREHLRHSCGLDLLFKRDAIAWKSLAMAWTATALLQCLAAGYSAAQEIWTGGGANDNWSTDLNWADGTAPAPGPTQSITFAGMTRLTPNQDNAPHFELNNLTFSPTAGGFTIGGNPLRFSGVDPSIVMNGAATSRIDVPVQLNAPVTTLSGVEPINGFLEFRDPISEVGGPSAILVESGTFHFRAPSTYSGGTIIEGGQVFWGNLVNALGTGPLTLRGGSITSTTTSTVTNSTSIEGDVTFAAFGARIDFSEPVTLAGAASSYMLNGQAIFLDGITESSPGKGFVKLGALTIQLDGVSTYTGTTTVSAGTFRVNGQIGTPAVRTGSINVQSGATFFEWGNGDEIYLSSTDFLQIEGGGTLQLRDGLFAPREMLVDGGGVNLAAGSTLEITIANTFSTVNSELIVNGAVTLGNVASGPILDFVRAPTMLVLGEEFVFINNNSIDPVIGTFQGLPEGAIVTDNFSSSYRLSYVGGDGNDVSLTVVDIPEPTSAVLAACLLAITSLGSRTRR